MIRFERARWSTHGTDAAGGVYEVVGERLTVSAGAKWGGVGVGYSHPVGVVRSGVFSPIRDLVLLTRLAAILAVALAALIATARR